MFFSRRRVGRQKRGGEPYCYGCSPALLLIAIAVTLSVTLHCSDAYSGEIWRITSLDWEPYAGSDVPMQGKSIMKLRALLQKEGIELVVDFYPWLRSKLFAQRQEYVGYFPAWPEEVDKGFIASSPIDWSEVAVLKNRSFNVEFVNIDDLFKRYQVGIVQSYVYPYEIMDAVERYPDNVDRAPNELSLMKKLSVGRHQVAITDPNVMTYLAARNGVQNIVPLKRFIMKKELVLAFRKSEDNLRRMELLEKLLKKAN